MLGRVCGRAVLLALALCAAVVTSLPAHAQAQRPRSSVVSIPLPQDDGKLTPHTFQSAYPLLTLVYDTLLWRDAQGVPRPWLARSIIRSRDGRRLTIRLAEGVRWHDGEPLTADDVAFSYKLARAREHPRFAPQLRDMQSIEATSPRTVVINLRRASLGFLDQPLADLPIVPEHQWEELGPRRLAPAGLPVGSGPYRLVAHQRGRGYRFEANPRYFLGRPAPATIRVPIIRDTAGTFAALEEGEVDMVPVSPPAASRGALDGLDIETATGASYLGTVLMFNLRRPPFDRVEARRAVASALDQVRIAGAVGDIGGETAAVASQRGYLHPASRWAPRRELRTFDEDGARRALRRLDLAPLGVLAADNDPVQLEAGRQVVLALRRAGVEAQLEQRSVEALDEAVGEGGAVANFELALWSAPPLASYDPNFLRAVFGEGAPLNRSGYASARFERLATQVAASRDERSRQRAVLDELRLLARETPVVPLFFQNGAFGFRPAAHEGWVFVKGSGILDKRSFLTGGTARSRVEPADRSSSPGSDPLPVGAVGLVALGLAAVAIGVLAWGSLRRRG